MAIDPNNPVAETNPALGKEPLISDQVQNEINKRQVDRIPSRFSFTPFTNPMSGGPQTPIGVFVKQPYEDAREKMGDFPASFIASSSSASPEGSAGRFTLSGPIADWWSTSYFATEWNNRAAFTNDPSYRDLYELPKDKAAEYLKSFTDELNDLGYPIDPNKYDTTEDFVDAVANAHGTQRALKDRTGLFEKWYSVPVGIFNLGATALLDPLNYFEFGLGTVLKKAIVLSTTKATATSAAANLMMRSSITRNPLKWTVKNVAIPTLKLTDNFISITPGATQSINRSAFNSILINSAQAAVQANTVANEFERQGWDYDPNMIFLETGIAAGFTGGLVYGINGALAGKRAWNQKTANKVDIADRVADISSEMSGTTPLPKYTLPENGGPDDVININTRAALSEEIAYQFNYLLKDPFYRHKEALDQKWWDAHVDSGVDQGLFLGWMRNNKPVKEEIDNFLDTVVILDQRAKALKMGKTIDARIENSWSDFVENELEVAGVAVRLGTEKDKIKNMAWLMANIKEMLARGNAPTVTKTLPDGSIVTAVDETELNSQVLAFAALVSSRAGSLGLSADDYVFRTFKDFVMDPRDSELVDKVLFAMAGTGRHGGWNEITKVDLSKVGTGEGTSWEGYGFYLTFGPTGVSKFYRDVGVEGAKQAGLTPFQKSPEVLNLSAPKVRAVDRDPTAAAFIQDIIDLKNINVSFAELRQLYENRFGVVAQTDREIVDKITETLGYNFSNEISYTPIDLISSYFPDRFKHTSQVTHPEESIFKSTTGEKEIFDEMNTTVSNYLNKILERAYSPLNISEESLSTWIVDEFVSDYKDQLRQYFQNKTYNSSDHTWNKLLEKFTKFATSRLKKEGLIDKAELAAGTILEKDSYLPKLFDRYGRAYSNKQIRVYPSAMKEMLDGSFDTTGIKPFTKVYKPGSISKIDVRVDTTTETLTWEKSFNDHSIDVQNGFVNAVTKLLNKNLTIAEDLITHGGSQVDTTITDIKSYLTTDDVQKILQYSGLTDRLTGETMYSFLAKLDNYWNHRSELIGKPGLKQNTKQMFWLAQYMRDLISLKGIDDKALIQSKLKQLDSSSDPFESDFLLKGKYNLGFTTFPNSKTKLIRDYSTKELKPISELLKSNNIYAMLYFGDEKSGKYRNMVVWDDTKLDVKEVLYNKDTAGKAKAAVGFENGRAILYGFQNATDIVSLSHELGHIFRRELSADQLARLSTWAGMDPEDVNWTVEAEEKFARAFEMYLATRKFAGYRHKGLAQVFSNYHRWMRDVYGSVDEIAKLGNIDAKINPNLKKTFDELLKPRFQPKVVGIDTALIGPEKRTGIVNLTIADPADRLAIQLARSTDFEERTILLQKLMDTTGMTEAETLYWSTTLWHNVKKQIREAKKQLKKGANGLQPGDPVKRTIKEYNTKLGIPGSDPKLVRIASQILARFDATGVDFFVDSVHKQFMDIAKKMNLKVSKELLDKTWVYMGTAGQLYGEKNPFTDELSRNQFLDAALGKLANPDSTANFETLRVAGEKIRKDANVIPDIIGPVEIKIHKTPKIDINVDAIKIPEPTDKQLEKFASKYMNMKDPTSIFARAMDEVTKARDERIALDQSGDFEAIKENRIRLRRALQNLRKVHSRYVPAIAGVSPAPVKLDIELGVVEANPGSVLNATDTSEIIKNASNQGTFGEGKENWLVYAKNKSLRTLRKWGNLFDQGSLATVGSQIPIIARFSHLISSHNLYTDSFGFSKMVGPGLEQRKRRVVAKVSKIIVDLNNTTKHLDDPAKELVMRHAMAKINNVPMASLSDPNLTRTIDSVANTLSVLFKEFEQRGLASGYFRGTLDAYSGTFTIRADRRDLVGLSEAFYKYFLKKFTQPDSSLHRKTVFEIPQFYTFNTTTGLYDPTGFMAKYGKVPEKFADLDAADKALYLSALSDTATDSLGIYNRGLRREALLAARNKLGMVETKADTDLALVKADTTLTRSLEVGVWFDPEVAQYVDWRIGEGLSQYASGTAYRISEKEGTNLFVQQLLGVSRRDIDIKNLLSGVENFLLSNTKLTDFDREKIGESFKYLTNQVNALRESFVSDITRKQGITDDIVDIASSIARVPVSARSALAGTVTELPMLLASVISRDGPQGLARIVKDILTGATKDQLKGIMAGYIWMRNHMPHTLQSAVNATHINRNWLDKTFVNPARVVAGSTGAMNKTKSVAAFLHHASSGLAGEDLLQGFISGIAVHSASVRVIRNWDRIKKLSEVMQKHNWAAETEPEKVFRKMAYDAGFGEDATYAATLNQSGLLDPKTIRELEEIDKAAGGRLLDKENGALDYGILESAILKNTKYRDTVERVLAHKETELTKHVTVPGVQDVNIPAGGLDPATKLKNMFTSFARSWFNNIMLNHIANEKLTYALFLVSIGLVGEMLYNISLRTMYHNEPLEDILEDLEEDPAAAVMLAIGRSNVFGTSNILPMFVFDQISGSSNASTQASSLYPISQTTALIRSIANMTKAAFSDDKEISEKDANRIESFTPIANSWWMKSVGEVTGWGGPAQWFVGKQNNELQPAN